MNKVEKIVFEFLGSPDISYDDKKITGIFSTKSLALLIYLLLNKEKTFTRQQLSTLLWPNSDNEAAFSNLRYNLWSINKEFKKMIDFNIIYTKKDKIKLKEKFNYYLDIENLVILKESDDLVNIERIDVMYKGVFLEGFYLRKNIEYNDWVFFERERLQRIYHEAQKKLLDLYMTKNMNKQSLVLLKKMIKVNAYDEDAYFLLIKLYLELGDKKRALECYNKCENVLREELNISPNKNIKELLSKIKKSDINSDNKYIEKQSEIKFIMLDKTDFKQKYFEYSNNNENKEIYLLECYNKVDYFLINMFLNKIFEKYSEETLRKKVDEIYLREISSLSIVFENIFNINNCNLKYSQIRLYESLNKLLRGLYLENKLVIFIKNYDSIDIESKNIFEFLLEEKELDFKVFCCNNGVIK